MFAVSVTMLAVIAILTTVVASPTTVSVTMLAVVATMLTDIVTPTTVIVTPLADIVTMIAVIDTMTTVKMAEFAIKTLKIAVFALFTAGGGQKATVITRLRQIADGRLCLVAAPGDGRTPGKSGGGPPQSKTLARLPTTLEPRGASWSAPAPWRFLGPAKNGLVAGAGGVTVASAMKMISAKAKISGLTLIGILILSTVAVAVPHDWVLKTGETIAGDYVSSGTTTLVVKIGGTNCFLKISNLSSNDLAFIAEMQVEQRQARLAAEAKQMAQAGMIEFTKQMIESFPEKVDDRSGWMDVKFLSLSDDFVYARMELGFDVDDKNGDLYMFCFAEKVFLPDHISSPDDISNSPPNPLIPVISNLKRGDEVRLIGKVVNGSFYSQHRLFHVEKMEMIESAAEKKARKEAAP